MMLKDMFGNYESGFYFVFRLFVGLLFFQHGAQKLLGWFGGTAVELVSLMGVAGIIELVGGLAVALGFYTRLAALVSSIEMLIAYFMAHASKGLIPIMNRGELALLYFAAFLYIIIKGAQKWSLEQALLKKETF